MKETLLACLVALGFATAPVAAQSERALADCAALSAADRTACEARNNAIAYCRPETDAARSAACVAEALRNPPTARKPGFASASAGRPAVESSPKKTQQ